MTSVMAPYFGDAHPGGVRLTDRAARLCGLKSGMSVLDMGCGSGDTVAYLAEKYGVAATGVERDGRRRGHLASDRRRGVRYVFADARTECVPDGGANAVFMECVLSVTEDPLKMLERARAALRPGGALAVSDVYLKERRGAPDSGGEAEPWDFDGLCELVRRARFDIVSAEDHTPALVTFRAERYAAGERGAVRVPRGLGYMLVIARRGDE